MGPSYEEAMWNLGYHRPQEQATQDSMELIRRAARDFTDTVFAHCKSSYERTEAIRYIDKATMHAIASLARHEQHVDPHGL